VDASRATVCVGKSARMRARVSTERVLVVALWYVRRLGVDVARTRTYPIGSAGPVASNSDDIDTALPSPLGRRMSSSSSSSELTLPVLNDRDSYTLARFSPAALFFRERPEKIFDTRRIICPAVVDDVVRPLAMFSIGRIEARVGTGNVGRGLSSSMGFG
jgi:hypothetical protein